MTDFDIVIVGAGIAGAGLAANLAEHKKVLMLEAEAHPGYHSTGRSAAFWDECYGGPFIQPLTTASGPFLANPPSEFHDGPLMTPRGALHIGTAEQVGLKDQLLAEFEASGVRLESKGAEAIQRMVPGIGDKWSEGLWEPGCCDIDVAALHAAYLRAAKKNGAQTLCNASFQSAMYHDGQWTIETAAGNFTAAILVNAAGAWADDVAKMAGISPLGIQPFRRTIVQLAVSPAAPADLPLIMTLDESLYFKPESGGRLWLSPHDETSTPPCDAAPEEIDIALAIDRLQKVVDWDVLRVEHSWAGLRSFAPDRLPVVGRDPATPEFFWLAGQGGFGIQTSPAISQLAASLLSDAVSPPMNINPILYAPDRL